MLKWRYFDWHKPLVWFLQASTLKTVKQTVFGIKAIILKRTHIAIIYNQWYFILTMFPMCDNCFHREDRRFWKCLHSWILSMADIFKHKWIIFQESWPKLVVVFGKVSKGKQINLWLKRNTQQKVIMLKQYLFAGSEESDVISINAVIS